MEFHVDQTGKLVFHENFDGHVGRHLIKGLRSNKDEIYQTQMLTGEEETCGSILSRSVRLAHALKQKGYGLGDVIMVCAENHNDSVLPLLASQYIGLIPMHIVVGMTKVEVKHFISVGKPKIIFSDPRMVGVIKIVLNELIMNVDVITFGDVRGFLPISDLMSPFDKEDEFECEDFDPDHTISILPCSSGTTGMPKLVALSHTAICIKTFLPYLSGDPWPTRVSIIANSPLYWESGVSIPISAGVNKLNRFIAPGNVSLEDIKNVINTYKPGSAFFNPVILYALIKDPNINQVDFSCMQSLYTGGSFIDYDTCKKFQALLPKGRLIVAYGATEAGLLTSHPGALNESVGRIHPFIDWKVVDVDTEETLGPNKQGELRIKWKGMFLNYYNDPESTAAAFDDDGYYKMGDLVYYNEDKYIHLVDRVKEMIKFRGYQISTIELENEINSLPGVSASAVVGLPHQDDDEIPMAFVQTTVKGAITAQTIKDHIKATLSDAKQLRGGVVFVGTLPMTYSGKIDRKALRVLKMTVKGE